MTTGIFRLALAARMARDARGGRGLPGSTMSAFARVTVGSASERNLCSCARMYAGETDRPTHQTLSALQRPRLRAAHGGRERGGVAHAGIRHRRLWGFVLELLGPHSSRCSPHDAPPRLLPAAGRRCLVSTLASAVVPLCANRSPLREPSPLNIGCPLCALRCR